jgi:hypothetical protein
MYEYNVAIWRATVTTVAVEKQNVFHILNQCL